MPITKPPSGSLHIRSATTGDTTPVEELHTHCSPRSLYQRYLEPVPRVSARTLEQLLAPRGTSLPRAAARRRRHCPVSGGGRPQGVGSAAAAEQPAELARLLVVVLGPRWRGGLEPGGFGSSFVLGGTRHGDGFGFCGYAAGCHAACAVRRARLVLLEPIRGRWCPLGAAVP